MRIGRGRTGNGSKKFKLFLPQGFFAKFVHSFKNFEPFRPARRQITDGRAESALNRGAGRRTERDKTPRNTQELPVTPLTKPKTGKRAHGISPWARAISTRYHQENSMNDADRSGAGGYAPARIDTGLGKPPAPGTPIRQAQTAANGRQAPPADAPRPRIGVGTAARSRRGAATRRAAYLPDSADQSRVLHGENCRNSLSHPRRPRNLSVCRQAPTCAAPCRGPDEQQDR